MISIDPHRYRSCTVTFEVHEFLLILLKWKLLLTIMLVDVNPIIAQSYDQLVVDSFFCNNKKMLIPLINILASCNYEKRTASATLETLPHFLGLLNNEIITRQRSSGLKTQITLTSPCHLIKLSHRSTIFSHISLENNPVQTSDFGYKIGDLSLN